MDEKYLFALATAIGIAAGAVVVKMLNRRKEEADITHHVVVDSIELNDSAIALVRELRVELNGMKEQLRDLTTKYEVLMRENTELRRRLGE